MGGRRKPKLHLRFNPLPTPARMKTRKMAIENLQGETLGLIKWRSGWRRYVAEFCEGAVFDSECMTQLAKFLDSLTDCQKEGWK